MTKISRHAALAAFFVWLGAGAPAIAQTPQTAEALLKLRAAHLSGDLDDYWEHHITHDQQRLYRRDTWQPAPSF